MISVKGQFLRVDGTPEVGTVEFHSRVYTLYSHASSAIVPSRISAALDYLGNLDIELPATNDPAWSPAGWKYTMLIKFGGDYSIHEVAIPYDAPGNELSLAELIPVGTSQPVDPANYAALVHNHTAADIVSGTIASARLPVGTTTGTVASGDHTHSGGGSGGPIVIADVTGLQTALDGKAASSHTHTIANVIGLQTALDTKVASSSLATVATTGSYDDLIDKPTIPTVPVTSVASRTGDVVLTKSDVDLANVDNTSDADKPVSTATQTALNLKANLASPTFTGTVSGISKAMVGLSNVDNTSDTTKNSAAATLSNKTLASPAFSGTPSGLTKSHVGLANVDNTADADKPVSTATQTALDLKASVTSVTAVSDRVTAVEGMTPVVMVWSGSAYVESTTARVYVGPDDPGTVPDGSVWIDTTP
jgi:hypothetical protein